MDKTGLIFAMTLDGQGGGSDIDWDGVRTWSADRGLLWVHVDYTNPIARAWLSDEAGIDSIIREALTIQDPRPRSVQHGDGLLLIVRGVNQNVGSDPEDMVSLRVWLESDRIISMRHRAITAVKEQREALARGDGPTRAGDFVVQLYERVLDRIGHVVDSIDEKVDLLEDRVIQEQRHELRHDLAEVRRQAIALRRYVAPQRAAMTEIETEQVSWLRDIDRLRIREAADHLQRMIEELDSARERASVTQEELSSRLSEMVDRRLYVLSLIAAVFLPLGLITSLLGINVGGIPWRHDDWAFWVVTGGLIVTGICQLWLFRKLRWL